MFTSLVLRLCFTVEYQNVKKKTLNGNTLTQLSSVDHTRIDKHIVYRQFCE